ncbi:MAG: anthranilate phosphoribosyltransferase [Alphaproteobacteria bacterium]
MITPNNPIDDAINQVANKKDLTENDAENIFSLIMSGDVSQIKMAALLMGLRVKGETVEEITGATRAMRQKALTISAPDDAIDTCGTGGDNSGTYNISTAAAIVIAACGVPVAKHGNKALSSKSGSADVLNALGLNLGADIAILQKSLKEANICFMMAPNHHSAMKYVAPVRTELKTRTIFNLLGPLANPAQTKRQIVGVFAKHWVEPVAAVLGKLGSKQAWVVHGEDGLDEITTTGKTFVTEYKDGKIKNFEINPLDYGFKLVSSNDLKGGDAAYNAQAILDIFSGKECPFKDIVILNAAAGLVVSGKEDDLKAAVKQARDALDSGKALKTLKLMTDISFGRV